MKVERMGLDLSNHVFELYSVDKHERVMLRKTVRRNKVLMVFAQLPPCVVAMEARSSAHHWARRSNRSRGVTHT